jgi:tetratricopeptide (TPR) repeat protein
MAGIASFAASIGLAVSRLPTEAAGQARRRAELQMDQGSIQGATRELARCAVADGGVPSEDERVRCLGRFAELLASQGEHARALELIDDVRHEAASKPEISPGAWAYFLISASFVSNFAGRQSDAEQFAREALAFNPTGQNLASAHLHLGRALRALDRPAEQLEPELRTAVEQFERIEGHSGFNAAVSRFELALAIQEKDPSGARD